MKNDDLYNIGIIGEGKMGTDIFNFLLDFDFSLVLICRTKELKETIKKKFKNKLQRKYNNELIDKKTYTRKVDNTIISDNVEDLSSCDIIIEAIYEDVKEKSKLFKKIDKIVNKECIFSSNSSSIIPSRICPGKKRKDKFVGLHFFYPIKYKNIVEIIKTEDTSDLTISKMEDFLKSINRFYLILSEKEAFILNKLFLNFQILSFQICEEKILDAMEIDELIKENIFPVGVFEFFDNVGLDIMYSSIIEYTKDIVDREFCEILLKKLKEMIKKNKLGVKTGSGFYPYKSKTGHTNNLSKKKMNEDQIEIYKDEIVNKLRNLYINSAFDIVEKGICSEEDIEYSIKEYTGSEKGPFELAKEIGADKIYSFLHECYKRTAQEIFCPSLLLKKMKKG